MSNWSPMALILLVGLIALFVFSVSRIRVDHRRRNRYRRKPRS